jgi:tagatose-1,6-bisphosphate aldolase non-catalytic subunit AgaZ/GatZ
MLHPQHCRTARLLHSGTSCSNPPFLIRTFQPQSEGKSSYQTTPTTSDYTDHIRLYWPHQTILTTSDYTDHIRLHRPHQTILTTSDYTDHIRTILTTSDYTDHIRLHRPHQTTPTTSDYTDHIRLYWPHWAILVHAVRSDNYCTLQFSSQATR